MLACYAALAVLVYLPVGPFDSGTLPFCNCGDNAMAAAFLEWTPWALLHGHNPFLTAYQYFPSGANLAANTTMPVLGLLLAPLTLTAGPVVSLNVLLRLGFVASAGSAYALVRRLGGAVAAAFVAGLVFGFSPYMLGQGEAHANLLFVPLLPLLALAVAEVVVRRHSARRAGLTLGLLAALQYAVSSELLADAAILGLVMVVLLAIAHRSEVVPRTAHAARSAGWALAAFVPLTAYPVAVSFFGPQHPNGPPRSPALLATISADLLGAVVPTTRQLLSLGALGRTGASWADGNLGENGVYLGVPLLAVVVWLAVRCRGDRRLLWAAIGTAVAYLLALGPVLHVAGHSTGVPLPDQALAHLSLLDGIVPVRFFVFGWLGVSVVLGLGLGRAWQDLRAMPAGVRRRVGAGALAGALALAVVAIWPQLPFSRAPGGSGAYASYAIPSFFSGGGVAAIPAGSPVVIYPYSDPAPTAGLIDYSVLWQAVSGERFEMLDGDATRPGPHGAGTEAPPPLRPVELESMMFDAYFGPSATHGPTFLHTTAFPALTPAAVAAVREALAHYDVSTFVLDPVGHDPDALVRAVTVALGVAPVATGGVLVWFGVQQDLSRVEQDLARAGG